MFTSLAAAVILSCKPYYHPPMPPPPTTTACEGSDQVRRNHDGLEVSRAVNACTIARCEGWDFVTRSSDGRPVSRVSSARRCMPSNDSTPVVVRPQSDALRYGLSYR
jgi:hypothetical protein